MSYRPARLHKLAELKPWNRFLGFTKVLKYRLSVTVRGQAAQDKEAKEAGETGIHERYSSHDRQVI